MADLRTVMQLYDKIMADQPKSVDDYEMEQQKVRYQAGLAKQTEATAAQKAQELMSQQALQEILSQPGATYDNKLPEIRDALAKTGQIDSVISIDRQRQIAEQERNKLEYERKSKTLESKMKMLQDLGEYRPEEATALYQQNPELVQMYGADYKFSPKIQWIQSGNGGLDRAEGTSLIPVRAAKESDGAERQPRNRVRLFNEAAAPGQQWITVDPANEVAYSAALNNGYVPKEPEDAVAAMLEKLMSMGGQPSKDGEKTIYKNPADDPGFQAYKKAKYGR